MSKPKLVLMLAMLTQNKMKVKVQGEDNLGHDFSKNKNVFHHLKLEIALEIPASNDEK